MVMRSALDRSCGAGRRSMRLGWDASGQVSFSVIAVVLLVSSAIAGTYIASGQLDQVKEERKMDLIKAMEASLNDLREEVSLMAAQRAQDVMHGWNEFPINETKISEEFSSVVRDYFAHSFPRTSVKYSTEVSNWTGGLFFVERNTADLIPSDETEKETCEVGGEEVEYERLP